MHVYKALFFSLLKYMSSTSVWKFYYYYRSMAQIGRLSEVLCSGVVFGNCDVFLRLLKFVLIFIWSKSFKPFYFLKYNYDNCTISTFDKKLD